MDFIYVLQLCSYLPVGENLLHIVMLTCKAIQFILNYFFLTHLPYEPNKIISIRIIASL